MPLKIKRLNTTLVQFLIKNEARKAFVDKSYRGTSACHSPTLIFVEIFDLGKLQI